MKDHKKVKWIRNAAFLVLVLVLFLAVVVISTMKQYDISMKKAWEFLRTEWSRPAVKVGLEDPTPEQTEEQTGYFTAGFAQGNYYVGDPSDTDKTTYPAGSYTFDVGRGELTFRIYEGNQLVEEWTLAEEPESGYERYRYGVVLKEGQVIEILGGGIGGVLSDEKYSFMKEIMPDCQNELYTLEAGDYEIGRDVAAGTASFWLAGTEEASLRVSEPYLGGADVTLVPDEEYNRKNRYCNVILREGDILQIRGGSVKIQVRVTD